MGVPGLVDKANCSREEAGLVARGFGPDGPQPPAGGKYLKEFLTRVGGSGHNLNCPPQGPRGEQVLKRWKIAANHLREKKLSVQATFVLQSPCAGAHASTW